MTPPHPPPMRREAKEKDKIASTLPVPIHLNKWLHTFGPFKVLISIILELQAKMFKAPFG